MKLFLSVTVLLAFIALAASQGCEQEVNCLEANGCHCATTQSPLPFPDTPQLVICSFNDAITESAYTTYYEPLFSGRMNPDFYAVSATFFVPHEYTDYGRVNALYREGHEIAVHSITKDPLTEYWLERQLQATVDKLKEEFEGQKKIISRFASIPVDDISGARVPNMALAGDNLFNALSEIGIEYDATWNVMNGYNYFPFTLDYGSQVICASGVCPYEWIQLFPVHFGLRKPRQPCFFAPHKKYESEFNVLYQGNRAPMNLVLSSAWFMATENSLQGLQLFLDHLDGLNDVYIVSHKKAVEWMSNPQPIGEFSSDTGYQYASCTARSCTLAKGDETRYMVSCVACPAVFPWLGNPDGVLVGQS
ncbi:hypothetical protein QE152_g14307 [Popillia japonica]|uniref:Chitin deacetylase n=1 Tax=Popillia japonica TaxID=7064 RepID=A0AAW1L9R0_POPJA